jgi:prepilin-type N-terminal cleavage/methylation domain-containing protein
MNTYNSNPKLALNVMNFRVGATPAIVGVEANDDGPDARRRAWPARFGRTDTRRHGGFTLMEMIVGMAVLSILIMMISSIFHQAQRGWMMSTSRSECYSEGRRILDMITADLEQAVAKSLPNGKDITFNGEPQQLAMVATVGGEETFESADLAEVIYVYNPTLRMLERRYTGPIGPQPDLGAGSSEPPIYQAMSTAGAPQQLDPSWWARGRGMAFRVQQTIYLTHVGVVDADFNGTLNQLEGGGYWWMVLAKTDNSWNRSWYMTKSSMIPSSPAGYMFLEIAETEVPPGEYTLYTNFFCGASTVLDKCLGGAPIFDGNNNVLIRVGERWGWGSCNYLDSDSQLLANQPTENTDKQFVNFRYRLVSANAGGGGGSEVTENIPGNWNIYDENWKSSFDTSFVVASNNVTAVSFQYGDDADNLSGAHTGATLPNLVKISVTVVDRRAAESIAAGGDPAAVVNEWGHTFTTMVHIPNAHH